MQGARALVVEPVRLASVLHPTKRSSMPPLTKIVATLGPSSSTVEVIEACLIAGMSVARFDFSWLETDYHQMILNNLRKAIASTKRQCAVMLDTIGPELQVRNTSGSSIELRADEYVTITPDTSKEPSSEVLPVNCPDLYKSVKKGDTIFIGQYLFTGSETTSVWLEVAEKVGKDVICVIKNSARLAGYLFTMHVSQVHINLPTITDADKQAILDWGAQIGIDFISLSYTRHAEDVRELRAFLRSQNLSEIKIFAKVESMEGLNNFDEILQEADGIILSRGNLGIDLPPEKVFLFQKTALDKCNMAGKPAIVTRVVDSMTDNLRPTRAEATDVANAILDGSDGILLGAETLRGLYPIETIKTVGSICVEAEKVCNQSAQFKRILRHVGEPMSHEESVASSAVRAAMKVKASIIIVFTTSGRAARLIAKYRPPMPVLAVVTPCQTAKPHCDNSATIQVRQCLALRGVFPISASPSTPSLVVSSGDEALMTALNHAKCVGLVKANDRVVVFEKIGDSSVVKIIECDHI